MASPHWEAQGSSIGLAILALLCGLCGCSGSEPAAPAPGSPAPAAKASAAVPPAAPTPAAPAELTVGLGGGVTMKMVLIRPGKFMMGSPVPGDMAAWDGGLAHEVTLTKPYYLGATEVTQAQYQAVMGTNPSYFKGPANPVEQVSWNEAAEFCKKLSEKTRQTFRLPTEAEWEYACRAGSKTTYFFGDKPADLNEYAWYSYGGKNVSHPVGQKKPNAWGLYDMYGNVMELCADWLGEYPKGAVTDPQGPPTGTLRTTRGLRSFLTPGLALAQPSSHTGQSKQERCRT